MTPLIQNTSTAKTLHMQLRMTLMHRHCQWICQRNTSLASKKRIITPSYHWFHLRDPPVNKIRDDALINMTTNSNRMERRNVNQSLREPTEKNKVGIGI